MKAKQYKDILWTELDEKLRIRIVNLLSCEPLLKPSGKWRETCACGTVIYKSITVSVATEWYTAKEQRHFNSKKHQQFELLKKLAGEETP